MESINSSRVRSLLTDGDLLTRDPTSVSDVPVMFLACDDVDEKQSSLKLSRISVRTGAKASRYLHPSTLDGERLTLRRKTGWVFITSMLLFNLFLMVILEGEDEKV